MWSGMLKEGWPRVWIIATRDRGRFGSKCWLNRWLRTDPPPVTVWNLGTKSGMGEVDLFRVLIPNFFFDFAYWDEIFSDSEFDLEVNKAMFHALVYKPWISLWDDTKTRNRKSGVSKIQVISISTLVSQWSEIKKRLWVDQEWSKRILGDSWWLLPIPVSEYVLIWCLCFPWAASELQSTGVGGRGPSA